MSTPEDVFDERVDFYWVGDRLLKRDARMAVRTIPLSEYASTIPASQELVDQYVEPKKEGWALKEIIEGAVLDVANYPEQHNHRTYEEAQMCCTIIGEFEPECCDAHRRYVKGYKW